METFGVFCFIGTFLLCSLILILVGYLLDSKEASQCEVLEVKPLEQTDQVYYVLSLIVREYPFRDGITDLVIRLGGSMRNSPLVFFHDKSGKVLRSHKQKRPLNLGFSFPFHLGSLKEIMVVANNSEARQEQPIVMFSDVSLRKIYRSTLSSEHEFKTWHDMDSIKFWSKGSSLYASGTKKVGKVRVLQNRGLPFTIPLQPENESLRRRAESSFASLHYLISLVPKFHDPWSRFSHFDVSLNLCSDFFVRILLVTFLYAFGFDAVVPSFELYRFLASFSNSSHNLVKSDWLNLTSFELNRMLNGDWSRGLANQLLHVTMISLFSSLLIIPVSLLTRSFLKRFGGKQPWWVDRLACSKTKRGDHDDDDDENVNSTTDGDKSFVLRTLECKSERTDSYHVTRRHLRSEKVVCGGGREDGEGGAKSVANMRAKLFALQHHDPRSNGDDVIHQSRTLTDTPTSHLPPISSGGGGGGVVRLCERVVKQKTSHVTADFSLVAECFSLDTTDRQQQQNAGPHVEQPQQPEAALDYHHEKTPLSTKQQQPTPRGEPAVRAPLVPTAPPPPPLISIGKRGAAERGTDLDVMYDHHHQADSDAMDDGGLHGFLHSQSLTICSSRRKAGELANGGTRERRLSYGWRFLLFILLASLLLAPVLCALTLPFPAATNRFFDDRNELNVGRSDAWVVSILLLIPIYFLITCNLIATLLVLTYKILDCCHRSS